MKRYLLIVIALLSVAFYNKGEAQVPGIPNKWQAAPPLDTGVVFAAAFNTVNKAWVVGGDTSDFYGVYKRYSRQTWMYDNTSGTWSRVADFPGKARIGAVGFYLNGKGYYGLGDDTTDLPDTVFSNYNTQGVPLDTIAYIKRGYHKDWWEYDPGTNTWTQKKDFPGKPRAYASGIAIGNRGYLGFGVDTILQFIPAAPIAPVRLTSVSNFPNSFWKYDAVLDSFTPIASFPGDGRVGAYMMRVDSAVAPGVFETKLFAGLGVREGSNYFKDWYSYDTTKNEWTQKQMFPSTGRAYGNTIHFSFLGYIVCGFDNLWLNEFWEYNGSGDNWVRFPNFSDSVRYAGVSFTLNRTGYVGAGFKGNSETMGSFQKWTIDTNTIAITTPIPDTLCASDAISVNWNTGATFGSTNDMTLQISNSLGEFEWPMVNSNLATIASTAGAGSFVNVILPKDMPEGNYKLRIVSSSPRLLGTPTKTFFIKSRPQFSYDTEIFPLKDTACMGSNHMISVPAWGSAMNNNGQLELQWLHNGSALANDTNFNGVNSSVLIITSIDFADSGLYKLVARGDCYMDTSLTFHVAVDTLPPPTIDSVYVVQPGRDTALIAGDTTYYCEYDSVSFTVKADGRHINYQWYFGDTTLMRSQGVSGINDIKLSMTGLNANDSGWYRVMVYEDCGSYKFSDSFYLGIRGVPRVIGEPENVLGNATFEGDTVRFEVEATGYELTYRWWAGKDSLENGGRFFGADTDSLVIYPVRLSDVEFYYVIVNGGCATLIWGTDTMRFADTSNLAVLEVETSPAITRQPPDTLELCEGTSGNIILVAAGANLNYQWQMNSVDIFDGGSISGTNTRTLKITNAQLSDAGEYRCIVTNTSTAIVISTPTTVIVNPIPSKPIITQFSQLLQADLQCETYIWYYNGIYQPQYTGQRSIAPHSEGDWTVRADCKKCLSEISEPLPFFRGSILEQNNLPITLYPNPATSQVTVELPEITMDNPAMIEVYDMTGRLVLTKNNVISNSLDIDINGFSTGMYAISITTNDASYSGKFIKE